MNNVSNMNNADFQQLLESITTLSPGQHKILLTRLSCGQPKSRLPVLNQCLEQHFAVNLQCDHRHSESIQKNGFQYGRHRYFGTY